MAKCPICGKIKSKKDELIDHVEECHRLEIPDNMSTAQYIYYLNHGRAYGTCRVCGAPTDWNEKTGKPKQICNKPSCREKLNTIAKKNMLKVYGKDNLLNDPLHQEKMLANRKISGEYIWSDNKHKFTYTGSYEKFALEWLDKVYEYDPNGIQMPGPIVYYNYDGEKKPWITDMYLPDLNLVIEFKDGSYDKNTHEGFSDNRKREKAKDDYMLNQKEYNYTKITNKNMMSLVKVINIIRLNNIFSTDKNPYYDKGGNPTVVIHESAMADKYIEMEETFQTPEMLFNWMKMNVKYDSPPNWKLKDSIELYMSKKGNCHDQAIFQYEMIKKMDKPCGLLFFIEYDDKSSKGGRTHTLSWYSTRGKLYWLENAWSSQRKIHGPYNSITDIKKDIEKIHSTEPEAKEFPLIEWGIPSNYKYGMDLSDYVDSCLSSNESIHENIISKLSNSDIDALCESIINNEACCMTVGNLSPIMTSSAIKTKVDHEDVNILDTPKNAVYTFGDGDNSAIADRRSQYQFVTGLEDADNVNEKNSEKDYVSMSLKEKLEYLKTKNEESDQMFSNHEKGTWNPFDPSDNFQTSTNEVPDDGEALPNIRANVDTDPTSYGENPLTDIANGIYRSNFN